MDDTAQARGGMYGGQGEGCGELDGGAMGGSL